LCEVINLYCAHYFQKPKKKTLTLPSWISHNKENRRFTLRRLLLSLTTFMLFSGCRSTVKPSSSLSLGASEPLAAKTMPLALGDGYSCVLTKKGQGQCLGSLASPNKETPAVWQVLRAAGSIPVLRNLVARSTVTCGIGVKPPSLENRILCWQPQPARTPTGRDQDAILLSAKLTTRLKSLSLQKDKICALLGDSQIACADLDGDSNALKVALVKGLKSMGSLRSGESFSCGARSDTGAIFCWGDNTSGQLGLGSQLSEGSDAIAIAGFSGFATAVDAGSQHVCAINHSGEVFCWGSNSHQQLAVEGDKYVEPQIVRGLPAKAESLALGEKHSCAQLVDGSVWCWGSGDSLGSDTRGGLIPLKVNLPVASANIVASLNRTCSQLTTGEFFCWGTEPEVFTGP